MTTAKKVPAFKAEEVDWKAEGLQGAWLNPETKTIVDCDLCCERRGLWKFPMLLGGYVLVCDRCKR